MPPCEWIVATPETRHYFYTLTEAVKCFDGQASAVLMEHRFGSAPVTIDVK